MYLLGFLGEYQLFCDKIQLKEGFALCMLQHFFGGEPNSLLDLHIGLRIMETDIDHITRIGSFCELMAYLLTSYATEEVLDLAVHDIEHFENPTRSYNRDYAHKIWKKAVRYGNLFSERSMKTIFANGLDVCYQLTVRQHMVEEPLSDLTRLALEDTAMVSMVAIRATHVNTVTRTTHKSGSSKTRGNQRNRHRRPINVNLTTNSRNTPTVTKPENSNDSATKETNGNNSKVALEK